MTNPQPSTPTTAAQHTRRWPVRHPVTGRASSDLLTRARTAARARA